MYGQSHGSGWLSHAFPGVVARSGQAADRASPAPQRAVQGIRSVSQNAP